MRRCLELGILVVGLSTILTAWAFGQGSIPEPVVAPKDAGSSPASAAVGSTVPSASNATATAPRPRFVPVLISATDANGKANTSLTKEQITLIDEGQPVQPLKLYAAADIPLHLGIVLVAGNKSFAQQQAAAIDLVKRVIRPNVDEAFVIAARGKKPWPSERVDWQRDPEELAKLIEAMDPNAGIHDAFNFDMQTSETGFDENGGRMTLQTYSAGGVTVFDAAYAMINSDPRPARRVLVMFREAWAHSPGFGRRINGSVETRVTQEVGVAQEMHVATFAIGLEDTRFNGVTDNNLGKNYTSLHAGDDGRAGTANREYDRELQQEQIRAYNAGRANVDRLAAETGGAVFWSTKKNYSDAVNSIANLLAGQYIATFMPADVPGPIHTLKVTSSAGGKVLAQSAFLYGTGGK